MSGRPCFRLRFMTKKQKPRECSVPLCTHCCGYTALMTRAHCDSPFGSNKLSIAINLKVCKTVLFPTPPLQHMAQLDTGKDTWHLDSSLLSCTAKRRDIIYCCGNDWLSPALWGFSLCVPVVRFSLCMLTVRFSLCVPAVTFSLCVLAVRFS